MTRQDAAAIEQGFNELVKNVIARFEAIEARVAALEQAPREPHKPLAQKLREKGR